MEGMEVGMVVILGRVTSVEKAATKTTYQVSKFISSKISSPSVTKLRFGRALL